MKLVLNPLLGSVGNEKLVCTNHGLQPLELHRDTTAVTYQWWRFYCLSNLQFAFRMGLSFIPTQVLYPTYWCIELRATWKCAIQPAPFPDDDLLSSGRTSYSFTIEVTPSLHAARGLPAGPSEREVKRGMLFSPLCPGCHGCKVARAGSPKT